MNNEQEIGVGSSTLSTDEELKQMEDLFDGLEINNEETAQKYMQFMQQKMDDLNFSNEHFAKKHAEEYEAMVNSLPRAVRRKYLKEKFSDRIKKNINTKK